MLAVKFDIGEGDGGRRTNFLVLFLTSPPPSFAPLSLSLSDATRVIPGTLGAKEPSPGFDDDGGEGVPPPAGPAPAARRHTASEGRLSTQLI